MTTLTTRPAGSFTLLSGTTWTTSNGSIGLPQLDDRLPDSPKTGDIPASPAQSQHPPSGDGKMPVAKSRWADYDARALTITLQGEDLFEVAPDGALAVSASTRRLISRFVRAANAVLSARGIPAATFRLALGGLEPIVEKVACGRAVPVSSAWRIVGEASGRLAREVSAEANRTVFFLLAVMCEQSSDAARSAIFAVPELVADELCFVNLVCSRRSGLADRGVLKLASNVISALGLRGSQVTVGFNAETTAYFPACLPGPTGEMMMALSHVEPLREAVNLSLADSPGDHAAALRALENAQAEILAFHGQAGVEIAEEAGLRFLGVELIPGPVNYPANPSRRSLIGLAELATGRKFTAATIEEILTSFIAALRAGAIRSGHVRRPGYLCGVFTALTEDGILANRVRSGEVSIFDFYRAAAISACGPDMIPLKAETTCEQLHHAFITTASIANRLEKPLAARFIRVPQGTPTNEIGDVYLGHELLGYGPQLALPGPTTDADPLSTLV